MLSKYDPSTAAAIRPKEALRGVGTLAFAKGKKCGRCDFDAYYVYWPECDKTQGKEGYYCEEHYKQVRKEARQAKAEAKKKDEKEKAQLESQPQPAGSREAEEATTATVEA